MTAEEIRRNLVEFARKWSLYDGTERAEAQTFLNELFAAYGQDRYEVGAHFEEAQAGRFLDLIWPRVCLVEMKRPSEAGRLASHREQALDYLTHQQPDVIFMDHLMPGMDGFQAVQAIKNNPRTATIPIMMYTSQEGELYLSQARALGAIGARDL